MANTYFERLVNSSKNYGFDMIVIANNILEGALKARNDSSATFEDYCNSDDETVKTALWASTRMYDGICEGYLKAYAELTSREIMEHCIELELKWVNDHLKENYNCEF